MLLYSELVFAFFWFADTNVKVVLGLACLGISCTLEADSEHSRYKGSALRFKKKNIKLLQTKVLCFNFNTVLEWNFLIYEVKKSKEKIQSSK